MDNVKDCDSYTGTNVNIYNKIDLIHLLIFETIEMNTQIDILLQNWNTHLQLDSLIRHYGATTIDNWLLVSYMPSRNRCNSPLWSELMISWLYRQLVRPIIQRQEIEQIL
jgi:hypothetical protein